MARPRISPEIKFREAILTWQSVIGCTQTRDRPIMRIREQTPNHAIALRHKLNACRAAIRGDKDFIPWDNYVVRLDDTAVEFWLKPPFDWSKLEQGDGVPLTPEIIGGAIYRQMNGTLVMPGESGRPATEEEINASLEALKHPTDAEGKVFDPKKLMEE